MTIRAGLVGSVEGATDELERIARRYRRFATDETEGISPLYTALAYAVADDRPTLEFLSALPRVKQQPNL
ncbi:MAG: DUF2332 domain-containing protein, partial [Acidimicrobiia bacterium]|nr:DUF2332 domain-containing protein [Acidimicrobiia bacterium]